MAKKQDVNKAELYEALAVFNGSLSIVTECVSLLKAYGLAAETIQYVVVRLEELRCHINSDVLATQLDRELNDWAKHGRLAHELEKATQSGSK